MISAMSFNIDVEVAGVSGQRADGIDFTSSQRM